MAENWHARAVTQRRLAVKALKVLREKGSLEEGQEALKGSGIELRRLEKAATMTIAVVELDEPPHPDRLQVVPLEFRGRTRRVGLPDVAQEALAMALAEIIAYLTRLIATYRIRAAFEVVEAVKA